MMNRLFSLLNHVNDLKHLPRMGWLLAGVAEPESVAEHSFSTAILALFLAESINQGWSSEGLNAPIDVDRVLRIAMIHDLAECILTDLPKRSAILLGNDVKRDAEAQAMAELMSGIPSGRDYVDLWCEYDAAATPEACVVKDADKLEMVHQALRYSRRGQANLDEFWQGHRWHYGASQQLFDQFLAAK